MPRMVARKRAKGPVQGSSRAFCSAGDSNVPAVAESKSELARVPGATTVKLIEAFDAMKEFEKAQGEEDPMAAIKKMMGLEE